MKKIFLSLFIIISVLIISNCYGANSDYLTYYLQQKGIYNSIVNKNINGSITYDDLCNSIDSKTSVVVYCESNWDSYAYPLSIYSTAYLKNEFSGTSIKGYSPTKRYEIKKDFTIVNRENYNSGWIWMPFVNGFYIGAKDSVNGSYVAGQNNINYFNFDDVRGEFIVGLIDENTQDYFNIAEVNVGIGIIEQDLTFNIYKYDSINGQKLDFVEELLPVYIDTTVGNNYYLQASKSSYFDTSDYAIFSVYNNVEDIIDIAYIVVESSSGGSGTIVIPSGDSGQIVNPSGEVTGQMDLSGVQNRLDGVNQNLGVINQNIEDLPNEIGSVFYNSGDSSGDNKGIVQKIYDDLFKVNDDYIENTIAELGASLGISGDEVAYQTKAILGVYNEANKDDFRISWDDFYFEGVLFIPSGDINFSKIERDNESVRTIMYWVRLILGFCVVALLIRQIWFLILKTLGVATEIYEDYQDENDTLVSVEEDYYDDGQSYRTTTWSKGNYKLKSHMNTTKVPPRRRIGF